MTSPSQEAIEAAIAGWNSCRKNSDREAMAEALTAALPFLDRPATSEDDPITKERAEKLLQEQK
jgi:hypothetical protein